MATSRGVRFQLAIALQFSLGDREYWQARSLFIPHIFDLYWPLASLPGKSQSF